MKFQIGDKVVVLHSNEEGEVVDIINNKMVMIDVRGVKFPAYIDQLDFPYFRRFSEKKLFPAKKEKQYVDNIPAEKTRRDPVIDGVWLSFIPVMDVDEYGDQVVEELKIHLVNRTATGYRFSYHLLVGGKSTFELSNILHAFEDFYVHDIPFEDISGNPFFGLKFSLLTADRSKKDLVEIQYKPKPKQMFLRIEELKKKGEAMFSHKLFDTFPDKETEVYVPESQIKSNEKPYDAREAQKKLEPPRYELDLHIEKLTHDFRSLSSFEKLTLQLQTFEKYLDLAITHRQHAMIVIHGVGTGKLRDEIHEILRLKKEVKSFVNQYHPAYGYGATEIFFINSISEDTS